ncbi:MAG: Gfo/Idh/MocA family oxidoreductase [Flavobacteriales bacterium]
MMKIGLVGVGYLGKIHLKILKELEHFELVGFFDDNETLAKEVEAEFGVKAFQNLEDLIEHIDVVDIVTSTTSHYQCAVKSINKGKHVFIEKPVTQSVKESEHLSELRKSYGTRVQIGHVERFNPAFIEAQKHIDKPMFVEAHRLSEFNPRGTDVSVVMDLMIHDLDILLHIMPYEIKSIQANGVCVLSETPDICSCRIEFENGAVANLTASRMSFKSMRKMRLFQKDAYVSIDFLEKKAELIQMNEVDKSEDKPLSVYIDLEDSDRKKEILFFQPECKPNNAIKEELIAFYEAINTKSTPVVSLTDGTKALRIACQIDEQISEKLKAYVD